jgi:hypothetical protein
MVWWVGRCRCVVPVRGAAAATPGPPVATPHDNRIAAVIAVLERAGRECGLSHPVRSVGPFEKEDGWSRPYPGC